MPLGALTGELARRRLLVTAALHSRFRWNDGELRGIVMLPSCGANAPT
jgi:hypothetical protein